MIRIFKTACVLIVTLASTAALAVDPIYTSLFSNEAIKGYDTVAYFTENKAVEGESKFSTEYKGATWLFSSQENLELFRNSPETYAPQYGGYCAYAVSQGSTASIKPELFTIHEGKLYLNYNKSINDKWTKNKKFFINDADKNWPNLVD